MKRLPALAAVAVLAGPASAQETGCAAQLNATAGLIAEYAGRRGALDGAAEGPESGVCHVEALAWTGGDYYTVKADRLSWSGENLDRMVTDRLPPTELAVDVEGLRFVPDIGDPVMTYLLEIQGNARTADVALRLDWDAETRLLQVERAEIVFRNGDYIRFSADVEGVDLSDRAAIQMSAGSFGITRVLWEIRSFGLFESFIVMPFGMAFLDSSDDPETRVAELKDQARDAIASIPEGIVPVRSKGALVALVDDMPNPAGTLRVEMTAQPGLGVVRAMPLATSRTGIENLDDIWGLMDGVRYDITYDRRR